MKPSEFYLKLLRWGIFASLFIPLIIFPQYLSPFHFGKMIVFRILVEILLVIYILLIIANKKYLPKPTAILISFTIFTGLYTLTSFTAVDFNYAFWGTLERMGGLFSFLHFWVFFIILISVFRERKDWERLLKISIFVGFLSILFAYGQRFIQGKFFIGWQHGERIIGTIGNPALFAGYLLFVLFLSIYFLLRKETKAIEKGFYGAVFILGLPVLHMTAVRGSVIAFWGALVILGLLYIVFLKNHNKIKYCILAGLIIFLALAGFLFINKNQPWLKSNDILNRLTDISLNASTIQTRLWSWHSGLLGWEERPILGWGPENFVLAHAKYFDPRHFTGSGSETIWDRAHNMVLETLTTMGIIGCLSYLSIFVVIYYLLIKCFTPLKIKKANREIGNSGKSLTGFKEKRIGLAEIGVFGAMIIAYFVHNLFIFDTTANYYMFFLVLGYLNYISRVTQIATQKNADDFCVDPRINQRKSASTFLIFILLILAIVLIFKTNIEPAKANYATTRAILAGRSGSSQQAFSYYQKALSYKSPQGKYEIRQKLATFIIQYIESQQKKNEKVNPAVFDYTLNELKKNIKEHPLDYISYLYVTRFYLMQISEKPEFGEQAEAAVLSALALNNKNPRVWYELGQVKLSEKKIDEAVAAFKQALELNPETVESYWFLGMAYAQTGEDNEEAIKYVKEAIKRGYTYQNSTSDTMRLINLYQKTGDYYGIIDCYQALIDLQPRNAQFYAYLAAAYKMVGDKENAIFYALKAAEIDPNFKNDTEIFINSLK